MLQPTTHMHTSHLGRQSAHATDNNDRATAKHINPKPVTQPLTQSLHQLCSPTTTAMQLPPAAAAGHSTRQQQQHPGFIIAAASK